MPIINLNKVFTNPRLLKDSVCQIKLDLADQQDHVITIDAKQLIPMQCFGLLIDVAKIMESAQGKYMIDDNISIDEALDNLFYTNVSSLFDDNDCLTKISTGQYRLTDIGATYYK